MTDRLSEARALLEWALAHIPAFDGVGHVELHRDIRAFLAQPDAPDLTALDGPEIGEADPPFTCHKTLGHAGECEQPDAPDEAWIERAVGVLRSTTDLNEARLTIIARAFRAAYEGRNRG